MRFTYSFALLLSGCDWDLFPSGKEVEKAKGKDEKKRAVNTRGKDAQVALTTEPEETKIVSEEPKAVSEETVGSDDRAQVQDTLISVLKEMMDYQAQLCTVSTSKCPTGEMRSMLVPDSPPMKTVLDALYSGNEVADVRKQFLAFLAEAHEARNSKVSEPMHVLEILTQFIYFAQTRADKWALNQAVFMLTHRGGTQAALKVFDRASELITDASADPNTKGVITSLIRIGEILELDLTSHPDLLEPLVKLGGKLSSELYDESLATTIGAVHGALFKNGGNLTPETLSALKDAANKLEAPADLA